MNSLQQKSQVAFRCELDHPRIEVTQCTVSDLPEEPTSGGEIGNLLFDDLPR